jgi:hypothetical protein
MNTSPAGAAAKTANVSYSLNEIRKTLSVPLIRQSFAFGTGMTDPVWKQAVRAEDFERFGGPKPDLPPKRSEMALFRTRESLVIGYFFCDSVEERVYPPQDQPGVSAWHGDLAELHFGSMGPDPWLLQLCVGITGIRFDSSGENRWSSAVFETPSGWGAEVMIPLDMLLLTEGGMAFNLCRCSIRHGDEYCWSPLRKRFHEVENFGELLFADYETVTVLRSGVPCESLLSREKFEQLRKTWEIPAQSVIHGPYISNPDTDSVCVNWETAGMIPACLEYRKKGSAEPPRRADSSKKCGILASECTHFVRLADLEPGTEYEYTLFSLTPVTDVPVRSGETRFFKTLPAQGNPCSFFCVTDLHSDAEFLRGAMQMPEARQADFHLLLGDNLSHAAGREALYRGVIDPIVAVDRQGTHDIPLVFVRGNHEQLGVFASEYFRVMRHTSGRTWYTFRCGGLFFIILDSGDDKSDSPERPLFSNTEMLEEEREFLAEVVREKAYRDAAFRLAFIHIPPFTRQDIQSRLVEPLIEAETPLTVMISGHWHTYGRIDADAAALAETTSPALKARLRDILPMPFVRIAPGTDDVLACRFDGSRLELSVLRRTPNGKVSVEDEMTFR